jgi:hypothetical protein
MSTTPPEQPNTQQQPPGYGSAGGGPSVNLNLSALMPTPGNAELAVYILAILLLTIIALASDAFNVNGWVTSFTVLTVAFVISRGIAKASRVLER